MKRKYLVFVRTTYEVYSSVEVMADSVEAAEVLGLDSYIPDWSRCEMVQEEADADVIDDE